MGLFTGLRAASLVADVKAQAMPHTNPSVSYAPFGLNQFSVSREIAMEVPSLARARNVIVNGIAQLPMHLWDMNERELARPTWMSQPDDATPRSVTMAWTVDSLFFFGVAYWQVTATFAEDNRPSRFTWVDPRRVTWETNNNGTRVTQYFLDQSPLPDSGVGSLITFQGLDEGVLARGARTIATAQALETAAYNMSKDPVPAGILKNSGFDLGADQVTEALTSWKAARQSRSTAYLNSSFDYQVVGFDAKNMQLTESRQYVAAEIARLANVPNWVVSADAGDSMTYANVIDQRKDLIAFSFGFMNAIEDRLSMNDITANGQRVRFELDHFLRANSKERAEVLKILLEAGIIDVTEARDFEDLSPRGSGDPA